jgi:hypothetical protein
MPIQEYPEWAFLIFEGIEGWRLAIGNKSPLSSP